MNEARESLATGAIWRFFSLLFRYPTEDVISSANGLLDELPADLRLRAGPIIDGLRKSDAQDAYHILLGSAGSVSPYESDYYAAGREGLREKGAVLGDVAAFYKAFEFDFKKELLEAPDHVAIELAYVSFLKLKQAYALMHGDEEALGICRKAEASFLNDHLLVWIPDFVEKIADTPSHPSYKKTAYLLKSFAECKVCDVS